MMDNQSLVDQTSTPNRLPDFVVIGAMKCATSSLHRYLAAHPDTAMSEPKELDFFIEPNFSRHGLDWYRQRFVGPADAAVVGESSVNYTKRHEHTGVVERMAATIPDAKLIYIVRDPLARIESHWVHSVGAGRWRGSFADAVADLEASRFVQTSRYWHQLEPFVEHYGTDRVKVLSYETLVAEPHRTVDEVLAYLGLPQGFDHPIIGERIHRGERKLRPNALGRLFWKDRVVRRRLRRRVPRLVGTPIPKPEWSEADRARVVDYLQPDVDAIRAFSGLGFDEWSL